MNTQANNVISIDQTTVKQDAEGRYCLNDLHKAAGGDNKHRAQFWLDGQTTRELISELEKDGIPAFSILRGRNGGTFVVRELVYSYAMWISR